MHIGILIGGGDLPGLNPCIKSVTRQALRLGWQVTGLRKGWAGPLSLNPVNREGSAEWLMPLDANSVRTIDRSGGTILHTSRTNPGKVKTAMFLPFLMQAGFPKTRTGRSTTHNMC